MSNKSRGKRLKMEREWTRQQKVKDAEREVIRQQKLKALKAAVSKAPEEL